MSFVFVCLIFGFVFCIECIIILNIVIINIDKLFVCIDEYLKFGDVQGVMEVCKFIQGLIVSIFYEGFKNVDDGVEVVEKVIVFYGSVQMGLFECGLVWIFFFIVIVLMFGFMGMVIGMIQVFDCIEVVGDFFFLVVVGGIKVVFLMIVFGLIIVIIL